MNCNCPNRVIQYILLTKLTGFRNSFSLEHLEGPGLHGKKLDYLLFNFPGVSDGKESACNVGDLGLVPGLGRSPGEGKGYPLQYSGLENSVGCIVHGVAESWT